MISFDKAIALIGSAVQPLPVERIKIHEAAGRVLAAPAIAAIDSPRADVSAMDGYALSSGDLDAGHNGLAMVGCSFPGQPWSEPLEPGTCARIFTGGPVPQGADLIVIQERVREEGGKAFIEKDVAGKRWIRSQGADFRTGDELVRPGRLLDPASLIAIAGGDVGEVTVFARPRLALLVTGDELVETGEARFSAFAVPDSVSLGIAALARSWGGDIVRCARLRDDLAEMEIAAKDAAEVADLVIVTGGASVGERDYAKRMFAPLSLELLFSKLAIRPGMPAWFGQAAGKLILGLPGNPTSAFVTARLLLAPLLAKLQGRSTADALKFDKVLLKSSVPAGDSRETFHRARLEQEGASLLGQQESHAQKALAHADVLVRQPAHSPGFIAGSTVEALKL